MTSIFRVFRYFWVFAAFILSTPLHAVKGYSRSDQILDSIATERERPGSFNKERWEQFFARIPKEEAPIFLMKAIHENDSLVIRLFCQYAPFSETERPASPSLEESFETGKAFAPLCTALLCRGYADEALELAQKIGEGERRLTLNTHLLSLLIDQNKIEKLFQSIEKTDGYLHGPALFGHCVETSHFEAGAALVHKFSHEINDEHYILPEIVVLLAKTGHTDEILSHLEKTCRWRQEYEESEMELDDYKERACIDLFEADCFEEALALWETMEESDLPVDDPDELEYAEEVYVAYCKALARKGQIEEALLVFEKLQNHFSRELAGSTCFATLVTLGRENEARKLLDRFDFEGKEKTLGKAALLLLEKNADVESFSLLLKDLEEEDRAMYLFLACPILASKGKFREACELCDLAYELCDQEDVEWRHEKEDVLDTLFNKGVWSHSLANYRVLIDLFPNHPLTPVLADTLRFAQGGFSEVLTEWETLDPATKQKRIPGLCTSFVLFNLSS